jgi:hypothetical protein
MFQINKRGSSNNITCVPLIDNILPSKLMKRSSQNIQEENKKNTYSYITDKQYAINKVFLMGIDDESQSYSDSVN